MRDIAILLKNVPGALAELGETLGKAGVSLEGGGVFVHNGKGIAHFLVEDVLTARKALEANEIEILEDREVLIQELRQDEPGQLGKICRLMESGGINIEVMYSDHYNRLILVVDDIEKGRIISGNWKKNL